MPNTSIQPEESIRFFYLDVNFFTFLRSHFTISSHAYHMANFVFDVKFEQQQHWQKNTHKIKQHIYTIAQHFCFLAQDKLDLLEDNIARVKNGRELFSFDSEIINFPLLFSGLYSLSAMFEKCTVNDLDKINLYFIKLYFYQALLRFATFLTNYNTYKKKFDTAVFTNMFFNESLPSIVTKCEEKLAHYDYKFNKTFFSKKNKSFLLLLLESLIKAHH